MSREDSRGNILEKPELRKLMKAPTVEGFVARRAKLSKTVSFQRKTLSSPPPPTLIEGLKTVLVKNPETIAPARTSVNGCTTTTTTSVIKDTRAESIGKVLTKLNSIGMESCQPSQAEDIVKGVRKILYDKMVGNIQKYSIIDDIVLNNNVSLIIKILFRAHVASENPLIPQQNYND